VRALAAVAATLLALAAWLLVPRDSPRSAARPLRVCLLDASASAVRCKPGWAAWARQALIEEARSAAAAGEDLAFVRFARDVELLLGPEHPNELERFVFDPGLVLEARDDSASDLAGAVELARELARGREPRARLRLLGDRSFTGADPRLGLARWAGEMGSIELAALPEPTEPDLALAELAVPEAIEAGAPLAAQVGLVLRGLPEGSEALAVELEITLDDARGRRQWTVPAVLPREVLAAGSPWSVRVELGPASAGRIAVSVRARLRRGEGSGDLVPEDDELRASLDAGDELVCAIVASEETREAAERWQRALESVPGLDLELESELALALAGSDVLVTVDIGPSALPEAALASFLERGGGWLACGGWNALAGWPSAKQRGAASLLPLGPPGDGEEPRDVILLVDGSGSMAGAPFDAVREAAVRLAGAARAHDLVSLRLFTDRLEPALALRGGSAGAEGERARAVEAWLAERLPGGPTDLQGVLEELVTERERVQRDALVLLLSDGRDQRGATSRRSAEILRRLGQARTRLAVFAAGEEADLGFLRTLVADGEEVRRSASAAELARLFERELARERVREGGAIPAHLVPSSALAPGSAGAEVRTALEANLGERWPELWRALVLEARPDAEVLAVSDRGEPLLAIARAGAGLAAVWAASPAHDWGETWTQDPSALAPLLRALGRGSARSERVRARIAGDSLAIENAPGNWPAALRAELWELAPGGERRERLGRALVSVPSSGAGDPSRERTGPLVRERSIPSSTWIEAVLVEVSSPAGSPALASLVLSAPRAEEFELPRRTIALPEASAAPAGVRGREPHPAGPPVLLAGLVLLAASALTAGHERVARRGQGIAPSRR